MNRPSIFSFIKISLSLVSLLIIIDSIIHVVREIIELKDELSAHEIITDTVFLIIVMFFRAFVSIISIATMYKEAHISNRSVVIYLSAFNAISITVITYLLPLLINFRLNVISLIIQLLTTYLSIAAAYYLLAIKYLTNTEKVILTLNETSSIEDIKQVSKISTKHLSKFQRTLLFINDNILAVSTLLTVVIAISLGALVRQNSTHWNQRSVKYVAFIGELFLRALKCLILPLIFSSLVFAMASLDTKLSGKIGFRIISYYMLTTVSATILGIILVLIIRPGYKSHDDSSGEAIQNTTAQAKVTTEDSLLDLIRNIFPDNIMEACFRTYQTTLVKPEQLLNETSDNQTISDDIDDWTIASDFISGTNILGIVVFAVIFGITIGRMPPNESEIMTLFFKSFNSVMMSITGAVIRTAPLAVLFLVLPQVLSVKSLSQLLGSVGWYTLCVMTGLFIHGLVVLPLIYFTLTRKNPFTFIAQMSAAIMTAFGTASSSATMPVTYQCLEERNHIDKRVVRFCIPLGATINMDGTALYEAVAALFIAQYRSIELPFSKLIVISITATAASIGAAGIPQAGLITMVIVLNATGLPIEDTALIFVVDWLIDRFRTAINVLGDAFGSGIVYHHSKRDLDTDHSIIAKQ